MSSTYHLRPVADISPSLSPAASTTPPGDHSPHYKPPLRPSPPPVARRRPMSPSSLRGELKSIIHLSFILMYFQNWILAIHLICHHANIPHRQLVMT